MSTLTIPNSFTANTTILSALMNANFTAITNWSTNIDHTNIGAAGLYPSQLLPTTAAEATFGATATGVGYKFLANDTTAVPLTISGVSSQSADIFDVTLTSGGTNAFKIGSAGAATFGFAVTVATGGLTVTAGGATVTAGNIIASNGIIGAQQAYAYATALTGASLPSGLANGDVIAQRASNTGRYYAGGSVNGGIADFNILNSVGWSFQNQAGYAPVFGGAYTNSSDASLKANIKPVQDALTSVLALKPASFTWVATDAPGLGFVAQDVQAVLPELVTADSDGLLGVNYDGIIPVCVAAIQELAARFSAYVAAHP